MFYKPVKIKSNLHTKHNQSHNPYLEWFVILKLKCHTKTFLLMLRILNYKKQGVMLYVEIKLEKVTFKKKKLTQPVGPNDSFPAGWVCMNFANFNQINSLNH